MWTERADGRRTPGCARPGWLRRAGFRAQETPGPSWGREREAAFGRRGWGFAGGAEFVSRITGSASRARSPPRQVALVARGSPARAGEGRAGRPAPCDIRFPVTLPEPNFLNSLSELAGMNAFPICRSAQNTSRTFFVVPPPPTALLLGFHATSAAAPASLGWAHRRKAARDAAPPDFTEEAI